MTPTAQAIPSLGRLCPSSARRSCDTLTVDKLEGILAFANKAASITTSRHGAIPCHAHPCGSGGLNHGSKTEFASRFAKHKDELEWLFMELYHNREGLEVLEREMAEAYNARSAELKALDKARSADPEWYKRGNMFGMTMYTDLFAGNLKELAKKLPYLKEQKLTYLHLMPLLQMPHPHNDGGYAVEDFRHRRPCPWHQQKTWKT